MLRHAEAADGLPDDDRPLTERGMRQAESAGRALAALGAQLDACLTSPKLRALQTAQLACDQLGVMPTTEPVLSGEPFDVHDSNFVLPTPVSFAVIHAPKCGRNGFAHSVSGVTDVIPNANSEFTSCDVRRKLISIRTSLE